MWPRSLWICAILTGVYGVTPLPAQEKAPETNDAIARKVDTLTPEGFERLHRLAENKGWKELAERLESNDPNTRRAAAVEVLTRARKEHPPRLQRGPLDEERPRRLPEGLLDRWMALRQRWPSGPATMVASGKYLFILRGNQLLQLDLVTLEILRQVELPPMTLLPLRDQRKQKQKEQTPKAKEQHR